MNCSKAGLDLIKQFEGLSLKPYICPAGVPTIGYGSTFWEDGRRVRLTDSLITETRADMLLINTLKAYEQAVDSLTRDDITQSQFDALVSFAYNLGATSLKNSTLLRKVNVNPNDKSIRKEFEKWVYADGKIQNGLKKRRKAEADLYFA